MIDINELRRRAELGYKVASDIVIELLDRLEAAEKAWKISDQTVYDLTEKVIPNIQEKLEAAEKERDALRAKIAEMEQQEPYSYIYEYADPIDGSPVWRNVPGYWNAQFPKSSKPLYAQPATSVPVGWQLVPTAESRHPGIYKMLGALHAADNTPGMSEWESYRAMLSEAPGAWQERSAQPAPSVPEGWIQRGMAELETIRNRLDDDTLLDDRTLIERIGKAMLAAAPEANHDPR